MKKYLIPLFLIGSVLFNSTKADAQEQDTFQQVMNYLLTGDPNQQSISGYNLFTRTYPEGTATIFDRQECVAGFILNFKNGKDVEVVKYYWNNVDINSITINLPVLEISGAKKVAIEEHYEYGSRVRSTPYTSYPVPVGDGKKRDRVRLQKAIRLLFTEHCSGTQSAF